MRRITVYVSTGLLGCKRKEEIEVEDDMTDDEIDEHARGVMFSLIDWGWYDAEKDKP